MRTKKGASVKGVFLAALLAIFGFISVYYIIYEHASSAQIPVDSKYSSSFKVFNESQGEINSIAMDTRDYVGNLTESPVGVFSAYGVSGILKILLAPLRIVTITTKMVYAFFNINEFVPSYMIPLIITGILILIIFAIVGFITTRNPNV